MPFTKIMSYLVFLLAIGVLSACKPQQQQIDGSTMGTYYSIKYVASSSVPDAKKIQQGIDEKLEHLNQVMSTYRTDSDISQFNASQDVNQPFLASPDMMTVVQEAARIHEITEQGFDITAGPLVNLWGFGPEHKQDFVPPADADIQARLHWTGMDKLHISENAIMKTVAELYLDLSAIAKGYGVDVVSHYLESLGINHYLVDIGGEVRAKGKNQQDKLWRIAIEKPTNGLQQDVQRIIALDNMSIATSGNYRNYFDANGVRYSHTIDPKTGYPIQNHVLSVTVITPECMTADGLATGFTVLGVDESLAIANRLDIAVFMLVEQDGKIEEHYSEAFTPYLTENEFTHN